MSRGGTRDNLDCKVYVGSLTRDITEKDLEKAFSYYGPVRSVWIARNPAGFAFVEFDDPRDADDSVRSLDGTSICGCRVRVENSTGKVRPKPWMRGSSYGGRSDRDRFDRDRGRPFDPDDKCYECGERGHYAYDCRRRGGSRRSRSRSPRRKSYSRSHSRSRSRERDRASRSRSRSASRDRDLVN